MAEVLGRDTQGWEKFWGTWGCPERLWGGGGGVRGGGRWQGSLWGAPTLIVEAVDAVDAGTLVVAPQQEEVLGVLDLVGQEEADGLQRLLAPVHVVTQEQVIALGGEASVLKKPQQVVVLPVDVT